jgi:hypothetical protein
MTFMAPIPKNPFKSPVELSIPVAPKAVISPYKEKEYKARIYFDSVMQALNAKPQIIRAGIKCTA